MSFFLNFIKLHKHNYFKDGNGKGGKRKVGSTESLDQPQKTFKKDMQTANGKEKLEQIANAAIASK